jgi:hypothetical protein
MPSSSLNSDKIVSPNLYLYLILIPKNYFIYRMRQPIFIIALLLLPMAALTQEAQITYERSAPPVVDSTYYISHAWLRPIYLRNSQEKIKMLNWKGYLRPEAKAKFEPYSMARQEIALAEIDSRKATLWSWGVIGIGLTSSAYFWITRSTGQYRYAVDLGMSILLVGVAIPVFYHSQRFKKSQQKAVEYLNRRQ